MVVGSGRGGWAASIEGWVLVGVDSGRVVIGMRQMGRGKCGQASMGHGQ